MLKLRLKKSIVLEYRDYYVYTFLQGHLVRHITLASMACNTLITVLLLIAPREAVRKPFLFLAVFH